MKKTVRSKQGFTLIEVMTTIAIIGILSAIALYAYWRYEDKARTADVISNWQYIDTSLTAYAADVEQKQLSCQDIAAAVPLKHLNNSYVDLSIGFRREDPTTAKTVLNICATSAKPHSFQVARLAHDYFSDLQKVETGAVVKSSVISFSVPILAGNGCAGVAPANPPACSGVVSPVPTGAGSGGGGQLANKPATGTPQSAVTPTTQAVAAGATSAKTSAPLNCDPGKESVTVTVGGNTFAVCAPVCPPGTTRDSKVPLHCVNQSGGTAPPATQQGSGTPLNPPALVCSSNEDKVSVTVQGKTFDVCTPKCPSGQTRDSKVPLHCVAQSGTGTVNITQQSGGFPPTPANCGAGQIPDPNDPQQCIAAPVIPAAGSGTASTNQPASCGAGQIPDPNDPQQCIAAPVIPATGTGTAGTSQPASCGAGQIPDPNDPQQCIAAPTSSTAGNTGSQSSSASQPQTVTSNSNQGSCPAGREEVTLHHGHNYYQVCVPPCPPGTRRSPGNTTKCIPAH